MADRPIPFSAVMVRALLDGRKTMTRRVIMPRGRFSLFDGTWSDSYVLDPGNEEWRAHDVRYAVGDRLWVREAWWAEARYDALAPRDIPRGAPIYYQSDPKPGCAGRYRHGKFMCRWMSRTSLLVTAVKVERLQDISRDDAVAEGLILASANIEACWRWPPPFNGHIWLSPRSAFHFLWASLHGPDAWAANPWVAAISFETHHCNIDELELANG